MIDAEGILRRARIRLRYHGWRRSGGDDKAPGWTLKESITGRQKKPAKLRKGFPSGEHGEPSEHELQALNAVIDVLGIFPSELDAWNDAPYRTVKDVLKAISRARKSISVKPDKLPDRCAQRRMASGDIIPGECNPNEGETMTSFEAEVIDLEEVIKSHLRGK